MASFAEQKVWSEGTAAHENDLAAVLVSRIPGCVSVAHAELSDDKNGTDYWANRSDGLPPLSIDLKARRKDWHATHPVEDDLALETWSSINGKVGWTRDQSKRTDYVLFYWADTRRYCLIAFHPLCRMFQRHWEEWRETFRVEQQPNNGYVSECVFVPREVVFDAIKRWSCNSLSSTRLVAV